MLTEVGEDAMANFDCLLVGHNELEFQQYFNILENMASSGGRDHVAFTDMQLNCVRYQGKPYQAMDILTKFYNEGLDPKDHRDFYNGDCLWTGITYLGSYLAKRGYTFDYINLFHWEKQQLREKLKTNNYRLIVLTGTMYVFEQNIWEIVTFIRRVKRDAKIIAGGPYISKEAEEREPEYVKPLFRYLNADFYCYSREGEQTLVKLIEALKNGVDVSTVHNLAYKKGNDYVVTPRLKETNPLADNMIDYPLFAEGFAKSGWANVRISDGCPYACGFCSFPEHGNERYVIMSLDRIEREFDSIKAAGTITHIFFIDATMNVPPNQFKAMLRMMIRKNYGFKWHCFFRCDQTDEETIQLMKEAGCMGVFLGLESANETVLKNMDKTAHKADFRRTMPWFKKYGLRQMISVQVGFPGETYESLQESFDFIEEIKPDYTRIQIWFCDATTPVWRKRDKFSLKGKAYGWSHYTMNAETAVELVVRSFMALEHVSWVPDPGYNWVSFYLNETRGMSIEQQKTFIKFFVAAAKEKLLKPNLKQLSPDLLENFKISAQFDRPAKPDLSVIEPYSGARYVAAEKFWIDEFRNANEVVAVPKAGNPASTSVARFVNSQLSEKLSSSYSVDFSELVFSCYGALLARISGQDEAVVVASLDEKEPFPVHFLSSLDSSFAEFARTASQKLEQARTHRLFAFFILTNSLRLKEFRSACPSFNAGCFVARSPEDTMNSRLEHYPAVNQQIDLLLKLTTGADGTSFEVSCPTGRHSQAQVEKVAEELMSALEALSARTYLKLNHFVWDFTLGERKAAAAAHQFADIHAAVQQGS
jgi:anaerobic magnesium-protoporphyrin IX monomethyl ester cyclase